jgi:hypothetical protein
MVNPPTAVSRFPQTTQPVDSASISETAVSPWKSFPLTRPPSESSMWTPVLPVVGDRPMLLRIVMFPARFIQMIQVQVCRLLFSTTQFVRSFDFPMMCIGG